MIHLTVLLLRLDRQNNEDKYSWNSHRNAGKYSSGSFCHFFDSLGSIGQYGLRKNPSMVNWFRYQYIGSCGKVALSCMKMMNKLIDFKDISIGAVYIDFGDVSPDVKIKLINPLANEVIVLYEFPLQNSVVLHG